MKPITFLTKDIKDNILCGINLRYRTRNNAQADRIIKIIQSSGLTPEIDWNAPGQYVNYIQITVNKCTLPLSEAEVLAFRLNETPPPNFTCINYHDSSFFLDTK